MPGTLFISKQFYCFYFLCCRCFHFRWALKKKWKKTNIELFLSSSWSYTLNYRGLFDCIYIYIYIAGVLLAPFLFILCIPLEKGRALRFMNHFELGIPCFHLMGF